MNKNTVTNDKQKGTIMKYKVGDKVKIKSLDWYNENKDKRGHVDYGKHLFYFVMSQYCGKIFTISNVYSDYYLMSEDKYEYRWTDNMIEGLVEEKFITTNGLQFKELNISLENEMEWNLPQGYQFKDENGNVINATKIVLEKIKKEYPKTYKECRAILDNYVIGSISGYKASLLVSLQDLLVCLDAYWKIAGEELGLDGPWEPDFDNIHEYKYGLFRLRNSIYKDATCINPTLLIFPTAEMRDAFYENFKELIEQCKELL